MVRGGSFHRQVCGFPPKIFMTYRLMVQHNKSDNEQSVTIINDKEDAKMEYLKSCKKDYFTQLERSEAENGKESCFKSIRETQKRNWIMS